MKKENANDENYGGASGSNANGGNLADRAAVIEDERGTKSSEKSLFEGMEKEPCYANLVNDFMFKRVLGCKEVMVSFLNRLFGDGDIVDVVYQNVESPGETKDDRKAVFDLFVRTDKGDEYIVEMQCAQQEFFRDRAVYYMSYPIQQQGRLASQAYKSEHRNDKNRKPFRWNYSLKPVRFVGILNFRMDHLMEWEEDRYHSSFHIREDSCGELMTDKVQFVFIELGRMEKSEDELRTPYEKWIWLFKNMWQLQSRGKAFSEKEFDQLFDIAKFANFGPQQMMEYNKAQKMIYDYQNTIDFAEKKGRLEGRLEGKGDMAREIAGKMKAMGMPMQQIMELTGLAEDAVAAL